MTDSKTNPLHMWAVVYNNTRYQWIDDGTLARTRSESIKLFCDSSKTTNGLYFRVNYNSEIVSYKFYPTPKKLWAAMMRHGQARCVRVEVKEVTK